MRRTEDRILAKKTEIEAVSVTYWIPGFRRQIKVEIKAYLCVGGGGRMTGNECVVLYTGWSSAVGRKDQGRHQRKETTETLEVSMQGLRQEEAHSSDIKRK